MVEAVVDPPFASNRTIPRSEANSHTQTPAPGTELLPYQSLSSAGVYGPCVRSSRIHLPVVAPDGGVGRIAEAAAVRLLFPLKSKCSPSVILERLVQPLNISVIAFLYDDDTLLVSKLDISRLSNALHPLNSELNVITADVLKSVRFKPSPVSEEQFPNIKYMVVQFVFFQPERFNSCNFEQP